MSLYSWGCDTLLGPSVSRLATTEKILYLTFDDGPVPGCTDRVLMTLERFRAKATFFVIAERARRHSALLREIQARGHWIGNHSLDHRFRNFFGSKARMLAWVTESESALRELGVASVGFRAPAGVRTPPLHAALKALDLPLIHWNRRFYDTAFSWTSTKALRSLARTPAGSIVLLHDSHRGAAVDDFLRTLAAYLAKASELGFRFEPLNPRATSFGTVPD